MVAETLRKASLFLNPISAVYGERLRRYGAEPRGVFWKNRERQVHRLEDLVTILDSGPEGGPVSVNDLGCGYGVLFDLLAGMPAMEGGAYTGYDISSAMVAKAQSRVTDPRATFVLSAIATRPADYSFASGTYNMNLEIDTATWDEYVKASLVQLWQRTKKGLAFNMLSAQSGDRQGGLFYADAGDYADFCRRRLSPRVTVIENDPDVGWSAFVLRDPG